MNKVLAGVVALALFAAGCGGSSDSEELEQVRAELDALKEQVATTTAAPTTAAPTTTLAPTTSTVSPTTTAVSTTTTTTPESTSSGKIAFQSDRDGDFEIFVMNGDGTEVRQLTDGDKEVVAEFPHPECLFRGEKCPFQGSFQMSGVPVWSPDGRQIAFLQMNFEGDWEAISVMNADGSDYRPLLGVSLKDAGPVWSPDGRQIAVVVKNGIVLINADGSGLTEIGDWSGNGYGDASWSPDGKQIVWYGFGAPEDGWGLHVVSTDGSNMRALIVDEPTESEWSSDGDPAWSPDGKHIAFYGERGEVFVVSPDGSDVRQLNDTSSGATAFNDVAPVWSPDGMEIAYTRRGPSGSLLINVVSADGSEVRELTDREIWPTRWHGGDCAVPQDWSDEIGDFSPVWSPDGTQIVFSSDRDCDMELFVMNADGSEGRQLTYNDTHDVFPSWTR